MVFKDNLRQLYRELVKPNALRDHHFSAQKHILGSIGWIQRAHKAGGDGGISKGYDLLRGRWSPSYPETTGYTIPTLLNAARVLDQPELSQLAVTLAGFLSKNSTPDGAVVHWQDEQKSAPIVFDTGQVMFGWLAMHRFSGMDHYLQSARNAGDWLIASQHAEGYWEKGQYKGVVKVIDTRVAWALVELFLQTGDERYTEAAICNLSWAMTMQTENGWFQKCAFTPGEDPITHTLAYTAEGLMESGLLLKEDKFVQSGLRLAEALLDRQRPDGSLSSSYRADWSESSRSSCLTGNCQMGRLWLRSYQILGDEKYLLAARKAIAFVAARQDNHSPDMNVRGAIAGSYPIYGHYERFKYPNWAAKFFVDSLLYLEYIDGNFAEPKYSG